MTAKEKDDVSKVMKQKINVLRVCSMTVTILLILFFLCGCGGGEDSTASVYISGDDIQTPIEVKLVHGTLLVVSIVVNSSINLDMLLDTGSSRTHVPAGIFGNLDGEVYISSLCLENGSSGLVTIPIHYETARSFTNISIEGISQGTNLLDTGSAYTRITSLMLDSLSQKPDVLFESVVFNFNGSEIVEYVPLTDYCVGMACPDEIIVQTGSWPAVGGTFFREYLAIFKFSENVVKLDRYYDKSHIKNSGIQRIGLQINIYYASDIIDVGEASFAWEGELREGYDDMYYTDSIPV